MFIPKVRNVTPNTSHAGEVKLRAVVDEVAGEEPEREEGAGVVRLEWYNK